MILALAAAGAAAAETPAFVERWRSKVDWDQAGDDAVQALSAYLQVDTVNPPGNEAAGVAWLGERLDAAGIEWEILPLAAGRDQLIARIRGSGAAPPLCLMHHIDVVGSEADRWPPGRGPLSGAVEDGYVWGRGALDMKGMGILQLQTAVLLQELGVPLARDVVLLAVADEEVDNTGAKALVEAWDRIGCSHLLNEGGIGLKDALFDGQAVHAISVAEKGTLWLQVHAEGRAGHGSTPYPDQAPDRLRAAVAAIAEHRPTWTLDDNLVLLLREIGEHKGGLTGWVLKQRFLVRTLAWGKLKSVPATRAVLHDTVNLTGFSGMDSPNVVPSRVTAQYDCRLLPGTDPMAHLARLQKRVDKLDGIEIEVLQASPANGSPVDDPLFETLRHYAIEDRPYAVAGPVLSPGFTDSLILRPLGVNAYGYVPFEVPTDDAETMHGHGERVAVDQVHEGLRRMFSIVVDFAGER